MSKSIPFISIITATFNSSRYIRDVYDSLINQTIQNWEWIITDDNSTDNTLSIINEICHNDSRVKTYQNTKNFGAGISRNNSISRATGDFLAFIDSDDLWLPNKLESQLHEMNDSVFSCTPYYILNQKQNTKCSNIIDLNKSGFYFYDDLLKKKLTLGCSTVLLCRKTFYDFKMCEIRAGQDYASWLCLLRRGHSVKLLSEPLSYYRITPGSISRNKFKKALVQWHIYRRLEKLNLFKSSSCFFSYAISALLR